MISRFIYSVMVTIAMPFAYLYLWHRAGGLKHYRKRLVEHFGIIQKPLHTGSVWLHAASVGEVHIALTVIKQLQKQFPQLPITLSTMTATGAQTAKSACQSGVQHLFFPFDSPIVIKRFLKTLQPCCLLLMEKELWPNLLYHCQRMNIPVALLNARISEKSFARYQRLPTLSHFMLSRLHNIAAQTEQDRKYFTDLGINPAKVQVAGNIKFDIELPQDIHQQAQQLRKLLGSQRTIFVAGSTHEGEDEILLACYQALKADFPELLLVLVPRHPQRFDAVASLCQQQGLNITRRSEAKSCPPDCDVFIGDSMGELTYFYQAADIAFVGGSLVAIGGHNVLEPIALGVATLCGPETFNFSEIIQLLKAVDAINVVADQQDLIVNVKTLLQNPQRRQTSIEAGHTVIENNRGALMKNLQACQDIITQA